MKPDYPVGWMMNEQKLIALVILHDDLASCLSHIAGEAFFRAFIVEDRKTGEISCNLRFRYQGGKDSWFTIQSRAGGAHRAQRVAELEEGITSVLRDALKAFAGGVEAPAEATRSFFPPDDAGDPQKTIDWLLERDLITVKVSEI
jgi:hypothetical protein